jgi:hypothetical protein
VLRNHDRELTAAVAALVEVLGAAADRDELEQSGGA